jgi:peptidoglycan/xylan/chitin deacetylase (PgdA/CDA1 family)
VTADPTTEDPTSEAPPVVRSGITRAVWGLRSLVSDERRAGLRRATDPWVGPLGSVRGAQTPGQFALTFDDGPGEWTEPILEVLARHGATATFFVLVEPAEAHPEVVRRIVGAGHEVGLHGLDHQRLTTLPPDAVRMHIANGKSRLERCLRRPVTLFRPPFGSQSPRTFVAARRCGLHVVVWTADADDWIDHEPSFVAQLALDRIAPGGVLLLHDGFASDPASPLPEPTFDRADALDRLLSALPQRGLGASSVSRLVAAGRVHRTAWFRP